eukprot:6214943-Karenia_brevis.AAC.1
MFDGPSLAKLHVPTPLVLKQAWQTIDRQKQWLDWTPVSDEALEDGLHRLTKEQHANFKQIVDAEEQALEQIKPLDWHSIRDDRFFCAPPAFFNELIPQAEAWGSHLRDNESRRARRLERVLAQ